MNWPSPCTGPGPGPQTSSSLFNLDLTVQDPPPLTFSNSLNLKLTARGPSTWTCSNLFTMKCGLLATRAVEMPASGILINDLKFGKLQKDSL